MIDRTEAEDHLRVIRSLMEKATIYRALSAPAALVGGFLSLAAALLVPWLDSRGVHGSWIFDATWAVVFIVTTVVSLILIQRDAARRGEPFFSHGARSAFRAMLPPMGLAAFYTLANFWVDGSAEDCANWWIALYGLALLAMDHFAPRSIVVLGWAFLIFGAVAISGLYDRFDPFDAGPSPLLGISFGLFHLVYAACTWPRRKA
jgi:hypothetical protein